MNIIFMGTPDFAVPALQALIESHEVQCVFTQPDRPKGRGNKLTMSPVKELALKNNLPVIQPEKLKNNLKIVDLIKEYNPDFIVVVAFGQILPEEILSIPKFGCVNLHASLLPKYRGAAPLNWCIIKGEKVTGNTTMLMDTGLDTGDMLLSEKIDLNDDITAGELHDLLRESGASLLIETLEGLSNGTISPVKQDNNLSCYAPMLDKKIAKIHWGDTAEDIHNLIRGLNPWPVAYTYYKNKTMKIHQSEIVNTEVTFEPGKF